MFGMVLLISTVLYLMSVVAYAAFRAGYNYGRKEVVHKNRSTNLGLRAIRCECGEWIDLRRRWPDKYKGYPRSVG